MIKIKEHLFNMKSGEKKSFLVVFFVAVVFSFAGASEVYYNHKIGYPGTFSDGIADFIATNDIEPAVVLTFDPYISDFFYSYDIFISYVYYYEFGPPSSEQFNMSSFDEFFEKNNFQYLILILNQKHHNQILASNFEDREVLVGMGTPLRIVSTDI